MGSSRMLTVSDVAEQLGVSTDVVRGWIHSGQLTAIDVRVAASKLGKRRWRIDPADLETFRAVRRTAPPAPPRRQKHNRDGIPHYFRDDGIKQFFK